MSKYYFNTYVCTVVIKIRAVLNNFFTFIVTKIYKNAIGDESKYTTETLKVVVLQK